MPPPLPDSYERCQVSFGRFIVDYIGWFLGRWQAFLTAPLTRRESEAMGVRSEKSAGCLNVGLWNVSTSRDWAYGSASASRLQAQVDGEENVHLAPSRAKLAASGIANAEDTILFLGLGGLPPLIPPAGVVNVTNQPPPGIPPQFAAIPPGFVAEAANYGAISVPGSAPYPGALGNILAAIANGIAALNLRAQPGPYALFLPPGRYAQSFEPPAGALRAPGDQINRVVTGGFYMVNSLAVVNLAFPAPPPPPDIGILVSLGGEPAKIILGTDATTAFTQTDPQGNYHFRVFERIQMVVQDGRAFQTLTFP